MPSENEITAAKETAERVCNQWFSRDQIRNILEAAEKVRAEETLSDAIFGTLISYENGVLTQKRITKEEAYLPSKEEDKNDK